MARLWFFCKWGDWVVSLIFFSTVSCFLPGWSGFFDYPILGMRHFAWSSAWINVARAANLDKKKYTTHKPPSSCRDHYLCCFSSPAREPQFIKTFEDTWKVRMHYLAAGREKHLFCDKSDLWCLSFRSHRFWWKQNGKQLHKGRKEDFEGCRNRGGNTHIHTLHTHIHAHLHKAIVRKRNSSSEYLNLGTIDILGTIILCCWRADVCLV